MLRYAVAVIASLALAGCATGLGGASSSQADMDLVKQILTDPACAHDDKINIVSGAAGIPASFQASAERHCPGRAVSSATAKTPGS